MIDDWWKNLTTSSPIGGIGGHRAVGDPNLGANVTGGFVPYQAPVAPAQSPPPMQPFGIGMGGGADVMPIPTYQNQIGMGVPAHRNVFGGGAYISEEGGMNVFERLGLDKDFLGAALASIGDFGKPAMRSGGVGGDGGGGARVGGNVKPTGLMSPILPDIPAVAPNPGFPYVLPRRKEDQYSGGL